MEENSLETCVLSPELLRFDNTGLLVTLFFFFGRKKYFILCVCSSKGLDVRIFEYL